MVSAGAGIGYAATQRLLAAPAQSECESPRRLRRPGSERARPDGVRPLDREKITSTRARVRCDRHRSAQTGADIFLSFLDWAHLVFGAHQRSVQAPRRNEAPARVRSLRHAIGTPRPFLHATLHNLGITPLSASTPVCGISKIGQIGGVGAGVVTNYRPTRTRLYQTKRDFDLSRPRCTPLSWRCDRVRGHG